MSHLITYINVIVVDRTWVFVINIFYRLSYDTIFRHCISTKSLIGFQRKFFSIKKTFSYSPYPVKIILTDFILNFKIYKKKIVFWDFISLPHIKHFFCPDCVLLNAIKCYRSTSSGKKCFENQSIISNVHQFIHPSIHLCHHILFPAPHFIMWVL